MALAGTLGGLAFSNAGVALVHAMEYPVGGAVHVSHGAGNGLLLPFVMTYNAAAARSSLARLPALLGADALGGGRGGRGVAGGGDGRRAARGHRHSDRACATWA